MKQDLRSFVDEYARRFSDGVLRVAEPVSLDFDVQAIALELERRRRFPIVIYENVRGHSMPIVSNVMASRRGFAFALGVEETQLPAEYSRRLLQYVKPEVIPEPPFRHTILRGGDIDLRRLPIPTYYPGDGGAYITAAMTVAKHPESGVETEGYHRFQVKGPDVMGVSLHSRRRMFEYQRLAEAHDRNLECAVVLGLHPLVGMGSLAYPPPEVSKFQVVGGLFGAPMQVAPCETIDLMVPAWGEIVIEGEILAGVREKEGPFGEFTGYFSRRSTEHVFRVKAICQRERPWYQSIASGRAPDHILPLALLREAEIANALARAVPNVKAVHVPTSGGSAFTAYVSMKQTRPGEARHAMTIVLGVDHYLKFVVVVDEDIDVFDESDMLWAVATRVQADRDVVTIPRSLGAILDPSASEDGLTAKMGIDATRPFGEPFGEKLLMSPEKMAWARALVDRLGA